MMRAKGAAVIGMVLGLLMIGGGGIAFGQQHEVHQAGAAAASAPTAQDDEEAIFCPTMKTGQLCTHGTAAVLGLSGVKEQQWRALARKYNQAVDAATNELLKEAGTTLAPQQVELLKAWFAVGLNPQINELLFSKGLGPLKKLTDSTEPK
ncbi:MAG: hypothetical protein HY648_12685 [Acidobacteria bacterium]|nr:hypothetical protein [Acidobacteriota bacterium]